MSAQDAIVIGGDFAGLAAAAYLTAKGRRVLVLEARAATPPGPRLVHALDPHVVKELRLLRRGLAFAQRDLPLVGLHPDGAHIVLGRDVHAGARSIAAHSQADAEHFAPWRAAQWSLARALRRRWWEGEPEKFFWPSQRSLLEQLKITGAEAMLASHFENDALKALLAFDACADGRSPLEAGSALAPLWRAAQEVAGLQGATALTSGDTLMNAVRAAAAGAQIRQGAKVAAIQAQNSAVLGVRLEDGEEIAAPLVFSSLSRAATRALAPCTGLAAHAQALRNQRLVGDARITLTLETGFVIPGAPAQARFVIADPSGAAHGEARSGLLPREPLLEFSPAAEKILHIRARPVPIAPLEGWKICGPRLVALCIAAIGRYAKEMIVVHAEIQPPHPDEKPLPLLGPDARPLAKGLFLCGDSMEPVCALSGRAARRAVREALA